VVRDEFIESIRVLDERRMPGAVDDDELRVRAGGDQQCVELLAETEWDLRVELTPDYQTARVEAAGFDVAKRFFFQRAERRMHRRHPLRRHSFARFDGLRVVVLIDDSLRLNRRNVVAARITERHRAPRAGHGRPVGLVHVAGRIEHERERVLHRSHIIRDHDRVDVDEAADEVGPAQRDCSHRPAALRMTDQRCAANVERVEKCLEVAGIAREVVGIVARRG